MGDGWSRIWLSRDIALGVNVNAALSGLKENLGSFFGRLGVAIRWTGVVDDNDFDSGWSVGVGIDVVGVGSFRGGAGGGCNVSGRFVSRRKDDGWDGGTIGGFEGCSWVETESMRMHEVGIRC